MTPAKNIQFPTPTGTTPPTPRQKSSGYTNLDNATDLALLLTELPNALVKPALYLMSRRGLRQSAAHWGEVAAATRRSQSQIAQALSALEALGLAVSEDGLWRWSDRKPTGNPPETHRKPGMAAPKNVVQDGSEEAPELRNEGTKEKEQQQQLQISSAKPAQVAPGAAAGFADFQEKEPETERPEQPSPDGAASGEANSEAKPVHSQEKNESGKGETINVTDPETVPPAAPATYREAQEALTGKAAWEVWRDWAKAHRMPKAAQDVQIAQFAAWVLSGLSAELRQHAAEITAAGSYAHPYPALVKRMERAQAVRDAAQRNASDLRATFGEARCKPGERRRDPQTAQVWTVEEIAYGKVIFEEGNAPQNAPDAVVAGWEELA